MTLELAKNIVSKDLVNFSKAKDCYVTFPDGAVFYDTDLDALREYASRKDKNLAIVIVKQNGKINNSEVDNSVRQSDSVLNTFSADETEEKETKKKK